MPRTTPRPGAPCRFELTTRDSAAACDFYTELLRLDCANSTGSIPGDVKYTEYGIGGTRYGGILPMTAEWGDMPSQWSIYVMAPNLDAGALRASTIRRVPASTSSSCFERRARGGAA